MVHEEHTGEGKETFHNTTVIISRRKTAHTKNILHLWSMHLLSQPSVPIQPASGL